MLSLPKHPLLIYKRFCVAVTKEQVAKLRVMYASRGYISLAGKENDFDFSEHFTILRVGLKTQLKEETKRNKRMAMNFAKTQILE